MPAAANLRFAVVVAVVALCGACPQSFPFTPFPGNTTGTPPAPPPGQCGARSSGPCLRNIDCAAGQVCEKPDGSSVDDFGCCRPVSCTSDADCAFDFQCDQRHGICFPDDQCDPGVVGEECAADERCLYVANGNPVCMAEDELPRPGACAIEPAVVVAASDHPVPVRAVALLSTGALAPFGEVTLSSSLGEITDGTFVGHCDGLLPCQGRLVGLSGAGTCEVPLVVWPPAPADTARLIIVDDDGAAVPGARAVWTHADGTTTEALTDALGMAWIPRPADPYAVTAIAPGARLRTAITSSTDVLLPVERPAREVHGLSGRLLDDRVYAMGDIQLGLVGLSHAGPPHRLGLVDVLGPPMGVTIDIDGVTNGPEDVLLSASLVMNLGTTELKPDWAAVAHPGRRILWSMGTRWRLGEIGPFFSSVLSDPLVRGPLAVAPLIRGVTHGVNTAVDPLALSLPQGEVLHIDDFPVADPEAVAEVQVYAFGSAAIEMPELPCPTAALDEDGRCADRRDAAIAAMLLLAADVPTRGQVPLGFAVGSDDYDTEDGLDLTDGVIDTEGGDRGILRSDWAPPHDGLEGQPLVAVAMAFTDRGVRDGMRTSATALVRVEHFDELDTLPTPFLALPGGRQHLPDESLHIDTVPGATFLEARMQGPGTAWDVLIGPDVTELDLAALRPPGLASLPPLAELRAYRMSDPDVDAFEVFQLSGTNLDRLEHFVAAYSHEVCDRVPWPEEGARGCFAQQAP